LKELKERVLKACEALNMLTTVGGMAQ